MMPKWGFALSAQVARDRTQKYNRESTSGPSYARRLVDRAYQRPTLPDLQHMVVRALVRRPLE